MEVGQHIWMIGPAGDNLVEEGTTTYQRVQPHVLLFFLSDQKPPHLPHYSLFKSQLPSLGQGKVKLGKAQRSWFGLITRVPLLHSIAFLFHLPQKGTLRVDIWVRVGSD